MEFKKASNLLFDKLNIYNKDRGRILKTHGPKAENIPERNIIIRSISINFIVYP